MPTCCAILLANVRTPDERDGDLTAQIAANRVGERATARHRRPLRPPAHARLRRRAAGLHRARASRRHPRDSPTAATPSRTRWMTTGSGAAGFGFERPSRSRATTPPSISPAPTAQVAGPVNANYAMTLSACLYAFRCLVGDDVLYNAGVSRPLTVIAPEGSIVNAQRPGGGGRRQRRDITAHHRRRARRARARAARTRAGREPGHDEQRDARRRRIRGPAAGLRTTKRSAAAWARAAGCRASAACTRT